MSGPGPCSLVVLLAALLPLPALSASVSEFQLGGDDYASCEIDLRVDRFSMFWKSDDGRIYGSLAALDDALRAKGQRLVCGTNGGIFDESQKPLGLFIENGALKQRLNTRRNAYGNFYLPPNGVFALFPRRAEILSTDEYAAKPRNARKGIRFANQSGPLLIRNGEVNPRFLPDSASRTTRNAVCLIRPDRIALVTALDPVNFHEFAHALQTRLQCSSALYLDGSLSSFFPTRRWSFARPLGVLFGVTAPAPRATEGPSGQH